MRHRRWSRGEESVSRSDVPWRIHSPVILFAAVRRPQPNPRSSTQPYAATKSRSPSRFCLRLPRLLTQILIPPLAPKNLILLPLLLLPLPLLLALVELREPLRPRRILLLLRRVPHHARVHGLLLLAAEEGGGEGAVVAAGCEVWDGVVR